jgi:C4-dicarboxylate-binding protein DctP
MTVDNPPATPRAAAEEYFASQVEKLSNGAMKVQIFWSGALGGVQKAALDTVRAGGAEIAAISTSNFSTMNRTWSLFDMPFVFDGPQALYKFMDSPEFDALKKDTAQKQGVRYVFTWYDNWRHLVTTKRPIHVPDEMKGAKLRTTGSPIETAYDVAFGAKPTAVDWGETYLALKNGLVDGYFIGYTTITNFKQNDAVKYGTTLNVVPIVVGMFMNESFYQKLSPENRKVIDEAGRLAELADRKVDEENDKASRKQLQGEGFVIHDPTPAEKALWVEKAKPVYTQFENAFPGGLIAKIQAIR